jgi:TRAP-type C4-dicarboxylate transport system permease small subunit
LAVSLREQGRPPDEQPLGLGEAAGRVLECTLEIVQQEVALARLELVQKLPATGRALLELILATVLLTLAGIALVGAAIWALAEYVFGFHYVFAGFAVMAGVLLAIGVPMAWRALRRARRAGSPLPTAALRQARELGETLRR